MKTQKKILKINEIKLDKEFYPRIKWDWFTTNDYKNSMKAGAEFPPIDVAHYRGKYYLIDGRHRIEANRQLKEDHIKCVVHFGLSQKQIFVLAVEMNNTHGRPLSVQDKVFVIDKLERFNINTKEISSIIGVPMDKIEKFKISKITNTVSGETIYLKANTKNYANIEVPDDFDTFQQRFSTRGQIHLFSQVIELVENGLIDFKDEKTLNLFLRLQGLVKSVKVPIRMRR